MFTSPHVLNLLQIGVSGAADNEALLPLLITF
jgi:hypothetical protein